MSELLGAYTFLPWVRRGLARSIPALDEPGAALAALVELPVRLRVEGAGDVTTTVRLHGPGDVTGLHPSAILRTDPRPGTTSFEAGYLAAVQFARPDLPWLFTPAAPAASGRLRPWLCLVAVRRGEGVRLDPNPAGPLPVLELDAPAAELPDLAQSWAWAHAQIAGITAGSPPAATLRDVPGRTSSRIVCPRRLEPDTSYLACLVPAFRAGVQAGLGEPVDEVLEPAWTADQDGPLRLPVYHAWDFATGAAGSFETLVRRLRPRSPSPEAAQQVTLDIGDAGGGLPSLEDAVLEVESALRIPGPDEPAPWPDATRGPFQSALEPLLADATENSVAPPVYGETQANAERLPAAGESPGWLRELNLDPRMRVAAATGARVVQERQEQLMAEAWKQAGALREVNAALARSQLARELGGVLERRLRRLPPDELLAITQPVHARVTTSGEALDDQLRASRVPEAAVSAAMRRLASPQGPLARRSAGGRVDVLAALDRATAPPRPREPAGMVALITAEPGAPAADDRPALSAESAQARLLERLRPEVTVLERVKDRVQAPAGTWGRPDPLSPVLRGPHFPQPMYEGLRDFAPQLLLPGLAHVEPDSVALLETSPRLIEAYMVGLNHEMSRELLWREFPADLAVTAFRQFWDVRGQLADPATLEDIPSIYEWADTPLGTHLRGGAQLVLLMRGELLRRYPTTTIYAAPATAAGGVEPGTRLAPMFRGFVPPDVTFVGFPLTEEAARSTPGWHIVFEEHPGEPRFGLDEQTLGPPLTPDDLAWGHVALTPSGHIDVTRPPAEAGDELATAWGSDAAQMARLTLQKPFRVALHASRLLGPPDGPGPGPAPVIVTPEES